MVRKMLRLRPVLQLGLEAHHVEQGAQRVVLAQLHDGQGLLAAPVGVVQAPTGFMGPKRRVSRPLGHDLDRQAAFEPGRVALPVLELGLGPSRRR
jgi:hypothetical protein